MSRTPLGGRFRLASALAVAVVSASLVCLTTTTAPAVAGAPDPAAPVPPAPTRTVHSTGNPIIADGTLYTADAAPLAAPDGKLYVYAGHDQATTNQGSFVMRDYTVLATDDVAGGDWDVYQNNLDPDLVFTWATGNSAYAGQVTVGQDGRYYWFVPIETKDTTAPNRMAIGVAVSDSPVGPWTDLVGAPLVTWTDVFGSSTTGQEVIDPHLFWDTDGTPYLYWGAWNVARVVQLNPTLTARVGPIQTLSGLTGFFEAPWVFKRNGIYHMVYDWKQGGSACTPSNYQACIGWATATSPTGPWTYRGIVLPATSATTMHPSIVEYEGQWYITYHTKDAVGGGHFRRSVAIDKVEWDGDTIKPIKATRADDPAFRLTRNVALDATATASFTETPPMRVGALNDGFRATTALLPPDQWGNYRGTTSANQSDWVSYQWDAPVRVDSAGIQFHQDSNWIRPPASWKLEYLDGSGVWQPVQGATYPTTNNTWLTVSFTPVTTTALRATFNGRASGAYYNSVSVSEWEVYAVDGATGPAVQVVTKPGVAPVLPEAVRATVGGQTLWAPTSWRPVRAADYAGEGTFTVQGRARGIASGYLTATVTVDDDATVVPPPDSAPPTVSIGVSGTQGGAGWYSTDVVARVQADDEVDYRTTIETKVGDGDWTSTPSARFASVTVSASGSTTIQGRARDAAGNQSDPVSTTVKIDKVLPTASAALNSADRSVTVTGSDDLSGLGAAQYRFDNAATWQALTLGTPVPAPDGLPHTFGWRVYDVAGNVRTGTVQVPLDESGVLTGNIARYATATASFTSGWENVNGLNDGTNDLFENNPDEVATRWGTWPQVGEQWSRLSWSFDVTTDRIGIWWFRDSEDAANEGMIPPQSWVLQYLDADGTTWKPVTLAAGSSYARTSNGFGDVRFEPVTTRALRIVSQSWGAEEGGGSTGIMEWQVAAAQPATETVSVSGTVGSASGPVPGSCVYLYTARNAASASYASCAGPDGAFTIPGVAPATYEVAVADPSGGHATQWREAPLVVGSTPVTGVDFTLVEEQTGSIVGAVTEQGTGAPLPTICVFAYDRGVSSAAARATCTDAAGAYGIYGADSGSYDVAFYDPTGRHPTQWWTGAAGGAAAQSGAAAVTVPTRGGSVRADAVLDRTSTGAVAGTVTAPGGAGVGGACVYLYTSAAGPAAHATCAQPDGTYWLGQVQPGSYRVAFADPSAVHATRWWTGTAGGAGGYASAVPITVVAGETRAGVGVTLPVDVARWVPAAAGRGD